MSQFPAVLLIDRPRLMSAMGGKRTLALRPPFLHQGEASDGPDCGTDSDKSPEEPALFCHTRGQFSLRGTGTTTAVYEDCHGGDPKPRSPIESTAEHESENEDSALHEMVMPRVRQPSAMGGRRTLEPRGQTPPAWSMTTSAFSIGLHSASYLANAGPYRR